jgi:hypothetical protein
MAAWQDIVLTLGSFGGSAALVPALFNKHKPPLVTSVPTTIILAVFIPTYASLHLWYTTVMIIIGFLLWGSLAVQEYLIVRKKLRRNRQITIG